MPRVEVLLLLHLMTLPICSSTLPSYHTFCYPYQYMVESAIPRFSAYLQTAMLAYPTGTIGGREHSMQSLTFVHTSLYALELAPYWK